ncbi:sensor histidine kinase [Chloroflexi bacterium TSY]|nr:sensor histidine kinase [Chloroflexi bacterium TSY]
MVVSLVSYWFVSDPQGLEWTRRIYATGHATIWSAYMSSMWLRRRLGMRWRPIGMGIAIVGPLIIQIVLNLSGFDRHTEDFGTFMLTIASMQILWLAPIFTASWMYSLRLVVLTAVASGLSILLLGLFLMHVDIRFVENLVMIALLTSVTWGIIGYFFWRFSQLLQSRWQQVESANSQLRQQAIQQEELTISRERNRLARELHDTLAHSLSGVTVQIEAARALWKCNPETAEVMLLRADEMARTGLTEARRALQALRATPLQDLGLGLALQTVGAEAAERAGATLQTDLSSHIGVNLEPHVEQGLYRIAQEALENIVRHARTETITLRLVETEEKLCLEVTDDGIGFNIDDAPLETGHYGLKGMSERAALCGGDLQVESSLGKGTTIFVSVRKEL